MATAHARGAARVMLSPAVVVLLLWMIVPLGMTIWFSFQRYGLLSGMPPEWTGLTNYRYFLTDPAFFTSIKNTLSLVGGVLAITVVGGAFRDDSAAPATVPGSVPGWRVGRAQRAAELVDGGPGWADGDIKRRDRAVRT